MSLYDDLPRFITDEITTLPAGSHVVAAWDMGSGVFWGGVIYHPEEDFLPFTYTYASKLRLYPEHATTHMMEAVRTAADICDEIWDSDTDSEIHPSQETAHDA